MSDSTEGWILDEKVAPNASLKQGDLIRFSQDDEKNKDPLKLLGIVVTADCDLKNKKHAKVVTMVPVVDVKTLMENYLLPEDCEKKRGQIESFAFKKFEIERQPDPTTNKAMLAEKILTNASNNSIEFIAAKFTIDELPTISVKDYKQLMAAVSGGVKSPTSLKQQISDRGDILVLPPPKEFTMTGNIAWLRHIWQAPLNTIAIRTSEIKNRTGERVARLNSPYRYRLTQLMAQVFSDIGLPDGEDNIDNSIQKVYDNA